MCGIAISDSLIPEANAPIDPIDCPNAEKNARKPPTSCNSLLFRKVAAAKIMRVAIRGYAVSKTPSALAARCDARKFRFCVENCLDHTASARAVASATRSFPIPAISCSTKPPILPCRLKYLFS